VTASLDCRTERRRAQVRASQLYGLDYLEVGADDQRMLTVYFLGRAPDALEEGNLRIDGGERVRDIRVIDVEPYYSDDPEFDDWVRVTVDQAGDFSAYTLRVVEADEHGNPTNTPRRDFDRRYDALEFSFKVGCPSPLDCATECTCPTPLRAEPPINYLAKDYASFRQLILDRLALLMPGWTERHVPDIGITLVELLAYVGDHLSYYQDAVATEAYLATARQRISVRRHARLVDYALHEGCNARTWVAIESEGDWELPGDQLFFLTRLPGSVEQGRVLDLVALERITGEPYLVFEPLLPDAGDEIRVRAAHNRIRLYTWGDRSCCLIRGATSATLLDEDRALDLHPGDWLVFEEVKGARNGRPADADPSHRHVVRLTRIARDQDPLTGTSIVEVTWCPEDALPFPLCVSAVGEPPECAIIEDVSVARGNVVLVDHGRRTTRVLGCVDVEVGQPVCDDCGCAAEVDEDGGRFSPTLPDGPLTFGEPLPKRFCASTLRVRDPRAARPHVFVCFDNQPCDSPAAEPCDPTVRWQPRPDLIGSSGSNTHFVAEVNDRGLADLRFGDGELGRRAPAGMRAVATYRVGGGSAGNVGAEAIAHLAYRGDWPGVEIASVRNPLAAFGGAEPEPIATAKLLAPGAYRTTLARAVTAADYARLAERDQRVQRAAATLRWTGSWYEALVAVDAKGAVRPSATLLTDVRLALGPYRRVGHELRVVPARSVPLAVTLRVCVRPEYIRGHVTAALRAALGSRVLPDGRLGFFHPDNLTFGGGIRVSALVAAAQAVAGVESVAVTELHRLFDSQGREIDEGSLRLGALEIARLDNDPSQPEHGRLSLDVRGGR
jgi:hypothetical protein